MLIIVGGIFMFLGLISVILNAPRAIREAFNDGIPTSHSVSATAIFFCFGFAASLSSDLASKSQFSASLFYHCSGF